MLKMINHQGTKARRAALRVFVPSRFNLFTGLALFCLMTGCDKDTVASDADAMTGGDWKKGALAIQDHGCASCHTIPGIHGADSKVGPPLTGISQRTYLAGILQNTPENLVKWIQNPPKIDEKTAMPDMHLSESDARNIASYLYTLR